MAGNGRVTCARCGQERIAAAESEFNAAWSSRDKAKVMAALVNLETALTNAIK